MHTVTRTVSSEKAGIPPVSIECKTFDAVEEWIELFDEQSILDMINQQYSRNVTNAVRSALQRGTPSENAQNVADEYDPRKGKATGAKRANTYSNFLKLVESGQINQEQLQELLAKAQAAQAENPA